ncbi:MAG: Mth938-like domain-containing protein [Rhodocyclaceae bacterium]
MKLQPDPLEGYAITGYGEGWFAVNERRYAVSMVVLPGELPRQWGTKGFEALEVADFEILRELAPDLVLIGTGARQRFPAPRLLAPLIEARIGFEVIDTAAACRTYNILMAEGRRVAAALLLA